MVKISDEKINKIKSNILSFLYHEYPKLAFTASIAASEARDEEFIKKLMFELKNQSLVTAIKKNPKGVFYSRRIRWTLSPQAYSAYKQQL